MGDYDTELIKMRKYDLIGKIGKLSPDGVFYYGKEYKDKTFWILDVGKGIPHRGEDSNHNKCIYIFYSIYIVDSDGKMFYEVVDLNEHFEITGDNVTRSYSSIEDPFTCVKCGFNGKIKDLSYSKNIHRKEDTDIFEYNLECPQCHMVFDSLAISRGLDPEYEGIYDGFHELLYKVIYIYIY